MESPERAEPRPDPGSADAGSPNPASSNGDTSSPDAVALSERDRAILDFERRWWRHAGSKEQAIRDRFSISPTRYYQLLNRLLDDPAALAYDPVLVKRLRRLRASRSRARGARRATGAHERV